MDLDATLRRRWCAITPDADALSEELLARWAEPHRAYHDRRHLLEVLVAIDGLAPPDPTAVRLAAWFHDACCEVAASDNEERSARLAEQRLPAPLGVEVGRLVRLTVSHDPVEDDHDGQVLCDADLAVLGAAPERYAAYTADVRREYARVPDAAYAIGRARVLRGFLERPRIYRTPVAYQRWEQQARGNLAAEVAALES